jgi:hypothetical protein
MPAHRLKLVEIARHCFQRGTADSPGARPPAVRTCCARTNELARELPLQRVTKPSNRGNIMKKASHFVVTGALVSLLPMAAFAQSSTPAQDSGAQQGQGATFESLDVNNDGRISKAEAEANANVKAQFASYDVNGDGYIERSEVNSTNNSQSETPKQ